MSKAAKKKRRTGKTKCRSSRTKYRQPFVNLTGIERLLREKTMNAQELAYELKVCPRTVLRYIDFLNKDCDAGIKYDAQCRGFIYPANKSRMPAIHASDDELFAAVVAANMLAAGSDSLFARRMTEMFDKLLKAFPDKTARQILSMSTRVSFETSFTKPENTEVFKTLLAAIQEDRKVEIEYCPLDHHRNTRQTPEDQRKSQQHSIIVYHLRLFHSNWFMAAKDTNGRNEDKIRPFNVNWIKSAKLGMSICEPEVVDFDAGKFFNPPLPPGRDRPFVIPRFVIQSQCL